MLVVIQITIIRSISLISILCFRNFKNIKCIFHLILVAHSYFSIILYRSSSMELLGLGLVLWGEDGGGWVWGEGAWVLLSNCCMLEVFWLCWWLMRKFVNDCWRDECCWSTCVICWYVGLAELSWNCWLALAYVICCWRRVESGQILSWCLLRVVWLYYR